MYPIIFQVHIPNTQLWHLLVAGTSTSATLERCSPVADLPGAMEGICGKGPVVGHRPLHGRGTKWFFFAF